MDIEHFLKSQVEAVRGRGVQLDSIRDALLEAGAPRECVAHVVDRMADVFDAHAASAHYDGTESAAEVAHIVQQLFRPVVKGLQVALIDALVENWRLKRDAAD